MRLAKALPIAKMTLPPLQSNEEQSSLSSEVASPSSFLCNLQADLAIQEHMQLRQAVGALRHYKGELAILAPKIKSNRSSEAEPFSKWLEEDPAEAFLTFDQDQAPQPEELRPSTDGQRRAQSAPVASSVGQEVP